MTAFLLWPLAVWQHTSRALTYLTRTLTLKETTRA